MGLCKCPKKVVTTLFCYEHRVNVCESCLVSNHPSCIIQSYYKWLQDSEYDPKCTLCQTDLSTLECVRLTCYHVFHWSCFTNFFASYPKTTAPAGFKCPICSTPIFPSSYLASSVADELRKKFSSVDWLETNDASSWEKTRHLQTSNNVDVKLVETSRLNLAPSQTSITECESLDFDSVFKQHRCHKPKPHISYPIEEENQKYRRRRPMTLRQSLIYLRRSVYCKFVFLILFTLFVLCVLFVTVIPTEFEDEKAFKRIVQLKERADQSQRAIEILDEQ